MLCHWHKCTVANMIVISKFDMIFRRSFDAPLALLSFCFIIFNILFYNMQYCIVLKILVRNTIILIFCSNSIQSFIFSPDDVLISIHINIKWLAFHPLYFSCFPHGSCHLMDHTIHPLIWILIDTSRSMY